MKLILPLLLLFLICLNPAKGEHITGGDFVVQHLEGNTFLARLTLYRDCASGGADFDGTVPITVFDAVTNEHLEDLDFVFEGFETILPELGNSCFTPDVCLEIGIYESEFNLPDNPNGYYLSNERCCRNNLSLNLDGGNLGFVFTVDIPNPLLQNSSPVFGEYPSEAFFCINATNTIDLSASDSDGDSLVYSLTEPLNGESTFFQPAPLVASAKPYSLIQWAAGFSTDDQVGGTPPITLNPETGILTATPDQVGVFTIAFQVEEFREGELIGTVRRELQLVSTGCDTDSPSVISTETGDTVFDVFANLEICIPIDVTDPNTGDVLFVEGEGELLDGTVEPLGSFPDAQGDSQITQDFCWTPTCENVREEPYELIVRAFSDGCAPEVLITEQRILINVVLPVNEPTTLAQAGDTLIVDLYDPSTHCLDFEFVDPNISDSLLIFPTSSIFSLDNTDSLEVTQDQGTATLGFCWNVECENLSDDPYFVDFAVNTTNCEVNDTSTFSVPIRVVRDEDIQANFPIPSDTIFWELYQADTLCFPFAFTDQNPFDTLSLSVESEIFDVQENPAFLTTSQLDGLNDQISGDICWAFECKDIRDEPYLITLTGSSNSCEVNETVVKEVLLYLDIPAEEPSVFVQPIESSITQNIGDDPIEFLVVAEDVNEFDNLTLSATSEAFSSSGNPAVFESFSGNEVVFSEFFWSPDCPDVEEEAYEITFSVRAESCLKDVTEELTIPILVTTPTLGEIEPIQNIFTPNGDGRNEVWTIEDKDDPCLLNFNSIVYDRWGKEVFKTDRSDFEWDGSYPSGEGASDGMYFHTIEYFYKDQTRNFTGNISIAR